MCETSVTFAKSYFDRHSNQNLRKGWNVRRERIQVQWPRPFHPSNIFPKTKLLQKKTSFQPSAKDIIETMNIIEQQNDKVCAKWESTTGWIRRWSALSQLTQSTMHIYIRKISRPGEISTVLEAQNWPLLKSRRRKWSQPDTGRNCINIYHMDQKLAWTFILQRDQPCYINEADLSFCSRRRKVVGRPGSRGLPQPN